MKPPLPSPATPPALAKKPGTDSLAYRCVCGSDVDVSTASGGSCTTCGRNYSPRVLDDAAAETYTFHGTSVVVADERDPQDDPLIGQQFGHYRVIERLGRGGMGDVYRALDESLQRYVALKVLRNSQVGVADSQHVQRLLQEAIAQARVNHPHVVHIYFVGQQGEFPFLAMELVTGNTVAQMLADGPLPFAQVIEIAAQMASALGHCASFDIVHGDIKPSNMLAASSRVIKLADFGLAQRLSQLRSNELQVAGTPNYLAPEVGQGAAPDIRSDMYALGVTLFEMTFGRLPFSFSGTAIDDRLRAHRLAPVEFPESWPPEVPAGWREVLARLLAKSADYRYPAYDDLLVDLEQLRPVNMPSAGRVPRFLAAILDLILACTLMLTIAFSTYALSRGLPLVSSLTFDFFLFVGNVAALGAAAALQMSWRTSPGKQLFQIRIVDRHGISPNRNLMGSRAAMQLLPIVGMSLWSLASALGINAVGLVLFSAAMLFSVIDCATLILSSQSRAAHDLAFGTQVCLDAR